jgi:hypothetical protein
MCVFFVGTSFIDKCTNCSSMNNAWREQVCSKMLAPLVTRSFDFYVIGMCEMWASTEGVGNISSDEIMKVCSQPGPVTFVNI